MAVKLVMLFLFGCSIIFVTEAKLSSVNSTGIKIVDEESNYNQSQAFRSWLHRVLETYDNRVRPFFGVKKLRIRLGLALIGISSISETDMSFSVEMFFHESWTDNRLWFTPGAFGARDPITLPLDAPKLLWTPDTSFLNALTSKVPETGSVSHLYSMMLYPNGTIGYSRRISVTAQCLMDLTMYPFDRQACTLELSSYGWTNDDIVYEWMRRELPIKGLSLADFDAQDSRLKVINKTYSAGNFSVPTFCVVLARRSGFCFLQLFVPATAVVFSSWISLWLDNETQFTDLVSVILAIIFLSYSYNTVMPKVSYVKAMDIYLLACFIFVFCSLVKLAIVKYMRAVVHKRKEKHAAAQAAAPPPPIIMPEPIMATETVESVNPFMVVAAEDVITTEHEVEREHATPLLVTANAITPLMATASMITHEPEITRQRQAQNRFSLRIAPRSWQRSHSVNDTRKEKTDQPVKRRRLVNRLAMQQAFAQRMLQLRWAAGHQFIHLPSLHDNYWKCMKAFHLGSQLILPIAFGAFAVFYFFIYPNVRTNQGTCD